MIRYYFSYLQWYLLSMGPQQGIMDEEEKKTS